MSTKRVHGYDEAGRLVHFENWENNGEIYLDCGWRNTYDAGGRISRIDVKD